MLTRKLWQALVHPPGTHPLYHRVLSARPPVRRQHIGAWIVFAYLGVCCGFSVAWSLVTWLPLLVTLGLLLANTAYSLTWALNISGAIARERENHTFDLLCVSPAGPLAVCWAICTGRLHRSQTFTWVYFAVRVASITLIATFAITLLVPLDALARGIGSGSTLDLLYILASALALAIIFYADHVQSLVRGCLIAMAAPTYMRSGSDARFRVVADLLFWQLVSYLLPALLALVGLPVFLGFLRMPTWFVNISAAFSAVLVFVAIGEVTIVNRWDRLARQLSVDWTEIDFLLPGGL